MARLAPRRHECGHFASPSATVLRFHRSLLTKQGRRRLARRFLRPAASTRPLALRNTDAKLAAALANRPLRNILPTWSTTSQQGYVVGRLPAPNVLWLDTASRTATLASVSSSFPPDHLWEAIRRHHAAFHDARLALQATAARRPHLPGSSSRRARSTPASSRHAADPRPAAASQTLDCGR